MVANGRCDQKPGFGMPKDNRLPETETRFRMAEGHSAGVRGWLRKEVPAGNGLRCLVETWFRLVLTLIFRYSETRFPGFSSWRPESVDIEARRSAIRLCGWCCITGRGGNGFVRE